VLADVLVAMAVYVATMWLAGAFDLRLVAPFIIWLGLYIVSLFYFVPRLKAPVKAGRRPLADDRAHHGRLHKHQHRLAVLTPTGSGVCALGHAGVHENRHANASGQRL
jgi:hypothetical protein